MKIHIEKIVVSLIVFVFAFQLTFPQYSAAYGMEGQLVNVTDEKIVKTLPISGDRKPVKVYKVPITAYSSTVDQCDDTPFITANGSHVKDGIVATNSLPFGTRVKFPELYGDKVFSVEDRMNKKYDYNFDIWMETRQEAIIFGFKYTTIEVF